MGINPTLRSTRVKSHAGSVSVAVKFVPSGRRTRSAFVDGERGVAQRGRHSAPSPMTFNAWISRVFSRRWNHFFDAL
jgi:hypothetical protein